MTARIEEELAEMNRLKRLELEFLFFKAGLDNATLQKYRDALTNENTVQVQNSDHITRLQQNSRIFAK